MSRKAHRAPWLRPLGVVRHGPVRKTLVPIAIPLLCLATGCVRRTTQEFVAADLTANEPAEPTETRSVEVSYDDDDSSDEGAEPVTVVPSAPPPARHPSDTALFRLGAGYGALGRVDLVACRNQGLQTGYLHVRVTFRDNGRVVRAALESRVAPPPDALACISEQLKLAMVPIFEGGDVTLSKSFFIEPPLARAE
jgi:hypothetical protein